MGQWPGHEGLAPCFVVASAPSQVAPSRAPALKSRTPQKLQWLRGWELALLAGAASKRRAVVTRRAQLAKTTPVSPPVEHVDMELDFAERAQDALMKTGREHEKGVITWNQPGWDFKDVAKIFVLSGKGGNGCKSFHREMYMPLMGPDGGSGGQGGDVILECRSEMSNTLKQFRERTHYYAGNGRVGMGSSRTGAKGNDLVLRVPPGTVVYVRERWVPGCDNKTNELPFEQMLIRHEDISERRLIGELTQHGQRLRVARGGRPGKGNEAFKTPTNTAPFFFTKGEPGRGRWIDLELKIISDIGIIGVPNAGKSSLLHAVTDKQPKIAAYPFTTTEPNLGLWKRDVHGGLTLVDVPGLIDGAATGRGMGIRFLRHIERCKTLLHVIDGNSEDPLGDYEAIQQELKNYSSEVVLKPQVIVVNKADLPDVQERLPKLMQELRRRSGHTRVFDISAATRYNCDKLMDRVHKWYKSVVKKEWEEKGTPVEDSKEAGLVVGRRELTQLGGKVEEVARGNLVQLDEELPKGRRRKTQFQSKVEWDVIDEAWRLIHPEVEKVAKLTDWSYESGYDRLNAVLKATGMSEAMKLMGLKEGETIIVHEKKFSYNPEMMGLESRMLFGQLELKTKKEVKQKNPTR
ncbi:unnamed protein product [Effrenium voratum]|nr:unnamed protein product [Effrenium voratum]|mmetsp:Transcript_1933/g.4600  ORF Transcript_1933/g.4600 Transcript_1933/m.4600 type:complete len:633 (-) Transcript_1933:61-1959(-)